MRAALPIPRREDETAEILAEAQTRDLLRDEAMHVFHNADLAVLLGAAARLRDAHKGKIVSYSKKVLSR